MGLAAGYQMEAVITGKLDRVARFSRSITFGWLRSAHPPGGLFQVLQVPDNLLDHLTTT